MSIGGGRPLLCSLLFKRVQCLCASECLLGLLLAICCTIGTLRPPWHCLTLSPSFLPSSTAIHVLSFIFPLASFNFNLPFPLLQTLVLLQENSTESAERRFSYELRAPLLLPSPFCPFWARSLASAKQQLHQITLHWRTGPFE